MKIGVLYGFWQSGTESRLKLFFFIKFAVIYVFIRSKYIYDSLFDFRLSV